MSVLPINSFRSVLFFFARLLGAYCILLILFHFLGIYYVQGMLPVYSAVIENTRTDYMVRSLQVVEHEGEQVIDYEVEVFRSFTAEGKHYNSVEVRNRQRIGFQYILPILMFSLWLAWPFSTWRSRWKAGGLCVLLVFFLSLLDLPVSLIGRTTETLAAKGLAREPSKIAFWWSDFLRAGGIQFFGLLGFGLAVISTTSKNPSLPDRKIGRNEQCPCGSGKKYKRCCGPILK